jgi:hypothetical protein
LFAETFRGEIERSKASDHDRIPQLVVQAEKKMAQLGSQMQSRAPAGFIDLLSLPVQRREKTLTILQKLLKNIQQNPENPKFRVVKRSYKALKADVFDVEGGETILKAAGFEGADSSDELVFNEKFLHTNLKKVLGDVEFALSKLDEKLSIANMPLYPSDIVEYYSKSRQRWTEAIVTNAEDGDDGGMVHLTSLNGKFEAKRSKAELRFRSAESMARCVWTPDGAGEYQTKAGKFVPPEILYLSENDGSHMESLKAEGMVEVREFKIDAVPWPTLPRTSGPIDEDFYGPILKEFREHWQDKFPHDSARSCESESDFEARLRLLMLPQRHALESNAGSHIACLVQMLLALPEMLHILQHVDLLKPGWERESLRELKHVHCTLQRFMQGKMYVANLSLDQFMMMLRNVDPEWVTQGAYMRQHSVELCFKERDFVNSFQKFISLVGNVYKVPADGVPTSYGRASTENVRIHRRDDGNSTKLREHAGLHEYLQDSTGSPIVVAHDEEVQVLKKCDIGQHLGDEGYGGWVLVQTATGDQGIVQQRYLHKPETLLESSRGANAFDNVFGVRIGQDPTTYHSVLADFPPTSEIDHDDCHNALIQALARGVRSRYHGQEEKPKLSKLSKYLVVDLCRFEEQAKAKREMPFPKHLDIASICSEELCREGCSRYQLAAVITHKGRGIGVAHGHNDEYELLQPLVPPENPGLTKQRCLQLLGELRGQGTQDIEERFHHYIKKSGETWVKFGNGQTQELIEDRDFWNDLWGHSPDSSMACMLLYKQREYSNVEIPKPIDDETLYSTDLQDEVVERLSNNFASQELQLKGDSLCLWKAPNSNSVTWGIVESREAQVNLPLLSAAWYHANISFSLDPGDKELKTLVKRFEPPDMERTKHGMLLYMSDVILKLMTYAEANCLPRSDRERLLKLRNAPSDDKSPYRVCFKLQDPKVMQYPNGILVPSVKVIVFFSNVKLTEGANGCAMQDIPTAGDHSGKKVAALLTKKFTKLAKRDPVLQQLQEFANAMVLAKFLKDNRIQLQEDLVDALRKLNESSELKNHLTEPELKKLKNVIPSFRSSTVEQKLQNRSGEHPSVLRLQRSCVGGVDFKLPGGIPLESKPSPWRTAGRGGLLNPRDPIAFANDFVDTLLDRAFRGPQPYVPPPDFSPQPAPPMPMPAPAPRLPVLHVIEPIPAPVIPHGSVPAVVPHGSVPAVRDIVQGLGFGLGVGLGRMVLNGMHPPLHQAPPRQDYVAPDERVDTDPRVDEDPSPHVSDDDSDKSSSSSSDEEDEQEKLVPRDDRNKPKKLTFTFMENRTHDCHVHVVPSDLVGGVEDLMEDIVHHLPGGDIMEGILPEMPNPVDGLLNGITAPAGGAMPAGGKEGILNTLRLLKPEVPLGKTKKMWFHLMYNDAGRDDDGSTAGTVWGHSKGVVAYDLLKNQGFFLQHSFPNFPQGDTSDPNFPSFPSHAEQHAHNQHFVCFRLNVQSITQIIHVLVRFVQPFVYSMGYWDWNSQYHRLPLPFGNSASRLSEAYDVMRNVLEPLMRRASGFFLGPTPEPTPRRNPNRIGEDDMNPDDYFHKAAIHVTGVGRIVIYCKKNQIGRLDGSTVHADPNYDLWRHAALRDRSSTEHRFTMWVYTHKQIGTDAMIDAGTEMDFQGDRPLIKFIRNPQDQAEKVHAKLGVWQFPDPRVYAGDLNYAMTQQPRGGMLVRFESLEVADWLRHRWERWTYTPDAADRIDEQVRQGIDVRW